MPRGLRCPPQRTTSAPNIEGEGLVERGGYRRVDLINLLFAQARGRGRDDRSQIRGCGLPGHGRRERWSPGPREGPAGPRDDHAAACVVTEQVVAGCAVAVPQVREVHTEDRVQLVLDRAELGLPLRSYTSPSDLLPPSVSSQLELLELQLHELR